MEISFFLIKRIFCSSKDNKSVSLKIILPFFILQFFSRSLIIDKAVKDLPLPDSPIKDKISELLIEKLISFRILFSFSDSIDKYRFLTSSNLLIIFIRPWVKSISHNI